ncbi:MAG: hypothetical protein KIT32_12060 [Rhodocyclaceae bacterium]|nr:hypothetical protein [Rhodocyclaceae bacterium]
MINDRRQEALDARRNASRCAKAIREYWAKKGVPVTVEIVKTNSAGKGWVYEIKSTGIPVRGA